MSGSLNPISAAWHIWRAIRTTARPRLDGRGTLEHGAFQPVLDAVASRGIDGLATIEDDLDRYIAATSAMDPDSLRQDDALAYWLNLYNAVALRLVARARADNVRSVLGVRRPFQGIAVSVGGEPLTLNQIEHGKIRRFGDPRIHAALVCGSVSCPTLRFEPFEGENVDEQLERQMRVFLTNGGATVDGTTLRLSRVFLWYSGDFVRRMPALLPASRSALFEAIRRWLPDESQQAARVAFQPYDWSLACSVR